MTNNDKTSIQNNENIDDNTQNTFNYRGRRLIDKYEEDEIEYNYNDAYEYDDDDDILDEEYNEYYDEDDNYEYYYSQLYDSFNSDDYAQKCTNRIPIIFKHLCVHWNSKNGFIFSYHSNIDQSNDINDHSQTSWFYDSRNDKIASAKVYTVYPPHSLHIFHVVLTHGTHNDPY